MKKIINKLVALPFWNKIVSQFIFSYVTLAAVSVSLVGIFLLSAIDNYIRQSVNDDFLEKAQNSATEINYFVNNKLDLLSLTANQLKFMDESGQNQVINSLFIENEESFKSIFIVDTSKVITLSTNPADRNSFFKNIDLFNKGSSLGRYVSPVEITADGNPMIKVANAIKDFDSTVGLLVAEIEISFIWELVDSLSSGLSRGTTFMVSNDGTVIAHNDIKFVYANENFAETYPFVRDLIAGKEGATTYRDVHADGQNMIGAYTTVKEFNWGFVVAQPESEALKVSRNILTNLIFIIFGSVAIASFLGIVIARNMVQPLKFLVDGVKRVSEGRQLQTIQVPKTDELATLATEFNNMVENLRTVQKKLRQAERLATVSKFASVVAHEVRNPFNSIVINMQVLKRGMKRGESGDRIEKLMDVIDSEIRRIDDLIQNYLSFANPRELQAEPVDLNTIINELIETQKEKALSHSVKLVNDTKNGDVTIPADAGQLKQAILNILLNSFQAMPDGGEFKVDIKCDHTNDKYPGTVQMSFSDTGVGIKSENISDVFDFFYSSKKGGTGLGLAVTKKIVSGHKGHIEIQSEVNKGTTISIYLPRQGISGETDNK